MQAQHVFVVLLEVFVMLMNEANRAEGKAECKSWDNYPSYEKCCDIPERVLVTEEEKAIGRKCSNIVENVQPTTSEKESWAVYECIEECFFNVSNLLTPDIKLNNTAIIAEYDQTSEKFPLWKEPKAKAIRTCIERNVASEVEPDAKCKSGSFQFSRCFGIKLLLNCPEENWKMEDEQCSKFKEQLKEC